MKRSYKMIGLSVLVGFLLSSTNLFAVESSTFSTTKPNQVKSRSANVYKVQRDFTLEQQVSVRTKKIGAQLQTRTKKKLDVISQRLLKQFISSPKNIDIYSLARKQIHKEFPKISDKQTEVLMVYTIGGLTEEKKKKLKRMNEMSEMTSLRLQMTMDRRSKFISTLSQLMKKISTTQDTLVQNIK
jgi:hypothetical protein